MAKQIELEVSAGKLSLVVGDDGSGVIEGRLTRETCPECNSPTCILDCEASQAANNEEAEDYDENYREAVSGRFKYNGVLDAIEALALAHACSGIDVSDPRYVDGIETVVDAAANNLS
jgi:type II secretory ATPase GspE/PulE/Tfp pilus assembly ATPase PilB-like protein